ncbi:tRNA epoxyqueuosine(34) reductase QueG [Benzoatithermus flavus]|uniref:Epoxyqueuosine reductase n=1 Tax=Benzoatithermus flavus TaxID=3108223 RepID=A0ABU8XNE3_9PROT
MSAATPAAIAAAIRERAATLGLGPLRFAAATLPAEVSARYRAALAAGHHGTMDWLAREPERRERPEGLWPVARTAIVCGLNYGPGHDPRPELEAPDRGYISVYARNRDYHDVLKGRLKELAGWIAAKFGAEVKVFVDTAPLLEKPLAQAAGLGWQGKHTNLVSRELGSWLFLGEILTTLELPADVPETDHCGRCRRCLDACPTDAFPAPYRLDARRCISYLTIEHKGPIPRELRPALGNRIYGCDDCLAVCPWNKFAVAASELKLKAREDLVRPPLAELAALDDASFRQRFAGSPVKRIGRDRFVRNVLIALGNSGDATLAPAAERLLADPSPLVRGMAVWALSQLLPTERLQALAAVHLPLETDPEVRAEWQACAVGDAPDPG